LNISVIIPTYNRAHVLARAIESVRVQTLKPAEIIVIDDGSEDGTAQLMRSRFPECRYVYQKNRGVSCARNVGIRMASGDWLAFLDSDDEWLPGKLAVQRDELADNTLHRLCHTEEIWVRNGRRVNAMQKHAKSGGHIFEQCLPLCVISPSAAVIHSSVFEEMGFFDESLPACEDYDMWLRICSREAVSFVNTPQIRKYGGHEDQLSRHFWGMDRFRVQALESLLKEPHLHVSDQIATLKMLLEKLGILMNGSIKRRKEEAVTHYMEKKTHYVAMLMVASRNENLE
jgi:glycosyltransferase involved in cell wall biosynthesis